MNDINKMPPVCAYCPYWEVCKPPYICPDIGDKKPDLQPSCNELATDTISRQALCGYALNQKDKSITANDIMRFPSAQPEQDIEHCATCIHAADSEDICILRKCKYAIAELKDCYEPKQPERKRGKWILQDNKAKPLYGCFFVLNAGPSSEEKLIFVRNVVQI